MELVGNDTLGISTLSVESGREKGETMLSGQAWWGKHASLGTHLSIFTVTQEGSMVYW